MFKKLTLAMSMALFASYSYAHCQDGHATQPHHAESTIQVTDTVLVENARVKATIPGIKVSSGYFSITNSGDAPLRFVAAETSASQHTEFHRMFMRDSKMAMRKVDYIEVEPKQTFELTPGGYHLMFMGVTQQLKPDTSLVITLIEQSGERYQFSMPIVANEKH
ncbi:copper chaperone PCu(A)C [Vibrio intestinalis]|uniref:copper chaperone PCu(A)C n=1 Tax=Vibrio intestinalis TaxID=2933291 RepID=UPI0021A66C17|nr:copper chaperone PCu(A)C [Vibrio intestinalis]